MAIETGESTLNGYCTVHCAPAVCIPSLCPVVGFQRPSRRASWARTRLCRTPASYLILHFPVHAIHVTKSPRLLLCSLVPPLHTTTAARTIPNSTHSSRVADITRHRRSDYRPPCNSSRNVTLAAPALLHYPNHWTSSSLRLGPIIRPPYKPDYSYTSA